MIWSNLERSVTLWKDLERETFTDNVDFDMMFTDFLKTFNELHESHDGDIFAPTDTNLESVGFA